MSVKKRGLGRGLSDLGLNELLSRVTQENAPSSSATTTTASESDLRKINIQDIQPGKYQPRKEMDSKGLEELADSIRSQGIIQPIVVRGIGNDRYEIIAGERRWRAAQFAGMQEIPVIIRDIPDDAAIAMALIENIQRENLNAIEEAVALQRLSGEFSLTHQEIAKIVGKSRATISNLLRLLSLHPEVKLMVEQGKLEMGHARALLALESEQQIKAALHVVTKQMSVREAELYIRRLQNLSENLPVSRAQRAPDLKILEKNLSKRLGTKVSIKQQDENKGKLIVHYRDQDQLRSLLHHFEE